MHLARKLLPLALLAAASGASAAVGSGNPAVGRALTLVKANPVPTRAALGDAYIARDVVVDAKTGTEHVRFDRTYNSLPVLGGDFVVHSRAGAFKGASVTMPAAISVSTVAKLKAADAITRATTQFALAQTAAPTARLVVYARGKAPKLAYEVQLAGTRKDLTPARMHYIVDANTGATIASWDAIHTGTPPASGTPTYTPAVGSGKSLLAGTVPLNTVYTSQRLYELKDTTRGGTFVLDYGNSNRDETATKLVDGNNAWGSGLTSDRATVAVDAAYGVAKTWDYYKATFGRAGVAGDGVGAMIAVHFQKGYVNAFWTDECLPNGPNGCMVFGDGNANYNPVVMIDVTGHEMSHGVTARTADLIYSGASGGLNEATSDIFGTMVEYFANNAATPPNYMIGEKLPKVNPDNQLALRYMFKPSLDGISPDCYPDNDPDYEEFFNNWLDVHFSSGVANHFYYLLAEGAVVPAGFALTPNDIVCNGNTTLAGIGRAAAQQIWYRALTVYMTSTTNYAGARAATMSAAADLYGAGSVQQQRVAAAWEAVKVH